MTSSATASDTTPFFPSLNTVYTFLKTPCHYSAAKEIVTWRNENVNVWRKIVTGTALATLGIIGLIETITRLAAWLLAAPITLPLEFFDYSFFSIGLKGTITTLLSAGKCFSVFQYQNIMLGNH